MSWLLSAGMCLYLWSPLYFCFVVLLKPLVEVASRHTLDLLCERRVDDLATVSRYVSFC